MKNVLTMLLSVVFITTVTPSQAQFNKLKKPNIKLRKSKSSNNSNSSESSNDTKSVKLGSSTPVKTNSKPEAAINAEGTIAHFEELFKTPAKEING